MIYQIVNEITEIRKICSGILEAYITVHLIIYFRLLQNVSTKTSVINDFMTTSLNAGGQLGGAVCKIL